jgi:hypothetical protein
MYHGRCSNATEAGDTLTSQRERWYVTDGVWGMVLTLSDFAGVSEINHECVFLKLQQQFLRPLLRGGKQVNGE